MMEDARAYQELRVGFTAAVSHELRTPLARLLALLDSAELPGPDSTLTLTARPGLLQVADDGWGVEEDELPRLFERFYRSDRARASRGTGLGLAIVKHVVASAGGRVEASDGPGRGLRVTCSFPAPSRPQRIRTG